MLSPQKMQTMKYLKAEYDKLQKDPILSLGCTVGLNPKFGNNIFHWNLSLIGPMDTPYAGGTFILTADFPDTYPKDKPEVRFTNKIYHLNVCDSNGHICISTLNQWKANTPMVDVISAIFALFYDQNPDSPYSGQMAREYRTNRAEFNRKAKEWNQKYAK